MMKLVSASLRGVVLSPLLRPDMIQSQRIEGIGEETQEYQMVGSFKSRLYDLNSNGNK